jgi:hypothetical protein
VAVLKRRDGKINERLIPLYRTGDLMAHLKGDTSPA